MVQLHMRREQLRFEEGDANGGSMTVSARIKFDTLKSEAEGLVIRTRECQVCLSLCLLASIMICVLNGILR
jgi:hypothetical protein